jgi:SAM-dependent methyltransferase
MHYRDGNDRVLIAATMCRRGETETGTYPREILMPKLRDFSTLAPHIMGHRMSHGVSQRTQNPPLSQTVGGMWVDRFLLPRLASFLPKGRPLELLQIDPDDEDEAAHLRSYGHHCTVILTGAKGLDVASWRQTPVLANPGRLPFSDASFDLLFTGAFGRVAHGSQARQRVAAEFLRVLRSDGGILLCCSNRNCPVDLLSRRVPIRALAHKTTVSFGELETAFAMPGTSPKINQLSLKDHFSFQRAQWPLRAALPIAARYLKWSSTPERWVYSSALNPILLVWVKK